MEKFHLAEDCRECDIIKVFHFIGARGKVYFMYKVIVKDKYGLRAASIEELPIKGDQGHRCALDVLGRFQIISALYPREIPKLRMNVKKCSADSPDDRLGEGDNDDSSEGEEKR